MRHPDRETFEWIPDTPTTSLEIAITTDASSIPAQSYAILLTARDSEGGEIVPDNGPWILSRSLGRYFQYSPNVTGTPTFNIQPWRSDVYIDWVTIEVLAWDRKINAPEVRTVSISPMRAAADSPRKWTVLTPTGNAQ